MVLVTASRVLRRLYRNCTIDELTPEWIENFSVSYYEPMFHLLSDEDFQFLARQPGFDFRLRRKLRRERMSIFRQYLYRLVSDFNRLHLATRLIIARSSTDHSHLVSRLMWLKLRFSIAVLRVEMSYALCWLGFRKLQVRDLAFYLEQINAQMRMASASQAVAML